MDVRLKDFCLWDSKVHVMVIYSVCNDSSINAVLSTLWLSDCCATESWGDEGSSDWLGGPD